MSKFGWWSLVVAFALWLSALGAQERVALRFSVREGTRLLWHIRTQSRQLVNMRGKTETMEMWLLEEVETIRPNGNLVWVSQVTRCVVDGQVLPADQFEVTVTELTPLGYPAQPITFPPPSLERLDDWLVELLGGVSLVFPATEVGVGSQWQHQLVIGLKPPNEPRRLTVSYRLEKQELVGKHDCWRIAVHHQTPVRLVWQWRGASVTVNGSAKLDGVFWFDPKLGAPRQRRATLVISYTRESEQWDGLKFVQQTQFVNQTVETEARLLSP